ncbi:PH domain-containing protein [Streptomyces sp. NPDC059009]|uniref:PH domain-containing protein n=1 Tax=Streptomyces sp. NPDC059009 TaxID=3346694 RepID=UPI00368CA447
MFELPGRGAVRGFALGGTAAAPLSLLPLVTGWGPEVVWATLAFSFLLIGVVCATYLRRRMYVGPDGLRMRTLWRWRRLGWDRIVRFGAVERRYSRGSSIRMAAELTDGRLVPLPLPIDSTRSAAFERDEARLQALHARHAPSTPDPALPHFGARPEESARTRLVHTRLVPLLLATVAIVPSAYVAVYGVPFEERAERTWRQAQLCPEMPGPDDVGRDCKTVATGVIARKHSELKRGSSDNWLEFVDDIPVHHLEVEYDTASPAAPGDRVTLTWWRGQLMSVSGPGYTNNEGMPEPKALSVVVTLVLPALAGATLISLARRRKHGQPVGPDASLTPTGLPFLLPLGFTWVWSVTLAAVRPADAIALPAAACCAAGTLALTGVAWWATGRRLPSRPRPVPAGEDVFIKARFLDSTPYNPNLLGTHVVLGAGPMAVVPHAGPGRFGAHAIPLERLRVQGMRRPLPTEEVSSTWYVADLQDTQDENTRVRLAAAPADLHLLIARLGPADVPGVLGT